MGRFKERQGEFLEALGVLVAKDSVADECTYYADAHKIRAGDYLLIPTGYAGFMNHSAKANVEKVLDEQRVYFRTLRTIEKDQELFWEYSEYAQSRFGIGAF